MPRYFDDDRSRYGRNYGNERKENTRRYSGDIFDSGRTGYRNDERYEDDDYRYGRNRNSEGLSRWLDNDHGRASWGSDYGWRSRDRESDDYRSRNTGGERYGRSSGRMYTGQYDDYRSRQNDFDDDDYSGRRAFGTRERRNYEDSGDYSRRRNSDYGTGFNEDNWMSNQRNSGSDYYSDRNRRSAMWDDDDDYERTSYRNRY